MKILLYILLKALLLDLLLQQCQGLIQLNRQNHKSELAKFNDRAVILFHQSWCNESREIETFLNSVQQLQSTEQDTELKINYLQVNINEESILSDKIPDKGYPSIYLYNKGNFTQYEYDVLSRRQFKYHIDLFFFEKPLNIPFLKSFEEQKQKFQFIFIGNKDIHKNLFSSFVELSKQNYLYTFMESQDYSILNKFFIQTEINENISCDQGIQSCNQEKQEALCSYVIIVRKYDKYDSFLRLCYDNEKSVSRMKEFFEKNQKPYRIFTFNHKIRRYFIEKKYYGMTLFYRKKVHQDEYLYKSFYNITRDVKSIIEDKKEDTYNLVTRIKNEIQSDVVFLLIDRFENKLTRKLAEYMEDSQFENSPTVFAFHFNLKQRTLDKFKFKIKHQDFIIFTDLALFLQSVLHESSQRSILFLRSKNLDESILTYNPKIIQLSAYYFERSYNERYLKMMKKEQIINIILYMTQSSRFSLELIPILSQVQKNIKVPNQLGIQFSLFDVQENDQELFEFRPQIKEVPEIRLYFQHDKYKNIDIQQISRNLEKNEQQLAIDDLQKQILEYINHLIVQFKGKDEL